MKWVLFIASVIDSRPKGLFQYPIHLVHLCLQKIDKLTYTDEFFQEWLGLSSCYNYRPPIVFEHTHTINEITIPSVDKLHVQFCMLGYSIHDCIANVWITLCLKIFFIFGCTGSNHTFIKSHTLLCTEGYL